MAKISKRLALATLGGAIALATVAACSSSGGGSNEPTGSTTSGGSTSASSSATNAATGGTLYYSTGTRNVEHWDPQRMYIGRDLANASRLFYRTLTQLSGDNKLVPDLATDTGTATDGGKTWSFTLKDGVKWQDGSAITCDDVKYGVSRGFAQDVITGGPTYALQYLDIPSATGDFSTAYHGPYTNVGQADFDKAVVCSGNTITFHLKIAVGDFNYAVSGALQEFAPYKKSEDKGDKSNFSVFSDGPYELQGTWVDGQGGTFVRNTNYDPSTDEPGVRNALPDKIVFLPNMPTETVFDRLLADSGDDQALVTDRVAPPAYLARAAAQKDRFTDGPSPFNDYLVPNFKTLKDPLVRQALAIATDRTGYITAEGGSSVASPATGLINPALGAAGGYQKFEAFPGTPDSGDPAKAKALLQQAGVTIPYPIHLTYSGGTPTTDKQAAALKAGYEKAGFKVTLEGLSDTYYDVIQNPANASKYDLTWAGWGADWPSGSTVIGPLFDSRVNLSKSSNGQDYGYYQSDTTNAAIDAAFAETDATKRAADWAALDKALATDVAYIPLDVTNFPRLHGSKVTNYVENTSTNGYPDLGQIGVSS
ncbi:MAG TPA: ABC transporter substrate-binding protein [Jatrophihabitans sp.]